MLEARRVTKCFPGVCALDDVTVLFRPGEIHALMGENGAGKSTLLNILSGVFTPDRGQLTLDGVPHSFRSVQEAEQAHIRMVHQELALAPNLSIAENICLGREPRTWCGIDWKVINNRAKEVLARLGFSTDVSVLVRDCSAATKQLTAIARSLYADAKILILDEPTSSLDTHEVRLLFNVLDELRNQGLAIIFVTHFIEQVFEISDRVTVLRNGQNVGEFETKNLTASELVTTMIGRKLGEQSASQSHVSQSSNSPFFEADHVSRTHSIEAISLKISRGETIGLAGLLGSGRTETLRVLYGIDRFDKGELLLDGHSQKPGKLNYQQFAFLPEDRKTEGLIPGMSVADNILLAEQVKRGWVRKISAQEAAEMTSQLIENYGIKASGAGALIESLSGGNQQKVLIARMAAMKPRLMFVDEPTRGVDVGAKLEIESHLRTLTSNGTALIVACTDLDELLRLTGTIAIVRDRKFVHTPTAFSSRDAIIRSIAGDS